MEAQQPAAPLGGRNLHDIVKENCPVFHLHPKEKYLPASVPWFLERCELRLCPAGYRDKKVFTVLLKEGEVTEEKLLEEQEKHKDSQLQVVIQPAHRFGSSHEDLNNVPVYAHAKEVRDESGGLEAYEINYVTLFPFNGSYTVAFCFQTGEHIGDWEHLTVRVDAMSGRRQGVWFNAHRNRDGCWVPEQSLKCTPEGRPIAYVALNGHGMYPWAGQVHRIFWFGNDVTSKRGPVWNPTTIHLLSNEDVVRDMKCCTSRGCCLPAPPASKEPSPPPPAEALPALVEDHSPWLRFNGYWGLASAIPRQNWFRRPEPPMSRTYWQRVLHFAEESKQVPTKKK